MRLSRYGQLVAWTSLGFLALAGCGDSGPPKQVVRGKIANAGNVLKVKFHAESKSGEMLTLWLTDSEKDKIGAMHFARINLEDGTFVIDGGDGRGVPQGKYKVCIEWKDKGNDLLKGKFSDAKSKIIREVPPPSGSLDIDISKPEG